MHHLNLEPSIGNHDEIFRAKWYQRLQEFSLTLVSDIIEYSTKVTEETSTQINVEQESLGKSLTPDDYKEVTEALQQNTPAEQTEKIPSPQIPSLNAYATSKFRYTSENSNRN